MKSTGEIDRLVRHVSKRCIMLGEFVRSVSIPVSDADAHTIVHVTLEAQNLWAEFSRAYYLSCAIQAKLSASGNRIQHPHPTVTDFDTALALAIYVVRGKQWLPPFDRRQEPAWHDVNQFLRIMTALQPSNLLQVQAAVSQPVSVLSDLPTFRNFFAHRCRETAEKARRKARTYTINPTLHPVEMMASRPAGRPQPLIKEFLDELRLVVEAM